MANFQFNANEEAPDAGRADPVPAAWYNLMVINSELKPTKAGTGTIVSVTLQVTDGQYANRKIFANFNTTNPSPEAQKIGRAQFSALCHAVGVLAIQTTEQLHNIPFKAKVKVRPASGDYEAQNEIAQYKHVNDPSAGQTGGAAVAPAALARPMPPAVPVARPMPPSPPVPQFAPPVQQFAPPVQQITEAQWNAQQAAIAAANAAAIAPAIVPTGWAPPDAPQPWATQPVQTTPQVMQNPPPDAQQAAPASQAVPPWMTQPTA